MSKARAFVIAWDKKLVEDLARQLRTAGYTVETEFENGGVAAKRIREGQPDVVVIDLSKKPSHGKQTASTLLKIKKSSHIPIVFVGASDEAATSVGQAIPNATFTGKNWTAVVDRAVQAKAKKEQP